MGVLVLSGVISDTQKAMFLSGGYQASAYGDAAERGEDAMLAELARGDYSKVTL